MDYELEFIDGLIHVSLNGQHVAVFREWEEADDYVATKRDLAAALHALAVNGPESIFVDPPTVVPMIRR